MGTLYQNCLTPPATASFRFQKCRTTRLSRPLSPYTSRQLHPPAPQREIQAVCRYTTYNIRGQEDKTFDDRCLKALPVGQAIKVKRGEGGWLFADWDEDNTQWHMGLNIEKEELKVESRLER